MPDTGWVTVGAGANNSDAGSAAWANVTNITVASDVAYASASVPPANGTSQYLHGTALGLAVLIPDGATPVGVEAAVRRRSGWNEMGGDHTIQLLKGGARGGDNKSLGALWSNTEVTSYYGGAADLWGLSLSRADVVSPDFGLAARVISTRPSGNNSIRIHYMQIKVHYTVSGNPGAFFALFNVKDRIREILKPKRKFWLPEPAFARAA